MSFTLTFGQEGNCATAQVVWSVNGETYNFRSDNNFVAWISTIFTVADVVASAPANLTNPLILPDNTQAYSLNTVDGNATGGNINLSGSDNDGGTIDMSGGGEGVGGSINLSNGGGSIVAFGANGNGGGGFVSYANDDYSGGSVSTHAGLTGGGGSITTSDGGGSINTTGQGSIGLGSAGSQTLITGTASDNRTATFPDNSGIIALVLRDQLNITFGVCAGNGAVTASAQTLAGAVVGDAVLVTCVTNRTTLTAGGTSNIIFDGVVTGDNAVSVRAHNPHNNSITLPALAFEIVVFKLVAP